MLDVKQTSIVETHHTKTSQANYVLRETHCSSHAFATDITTRLPFYCNRQCHLLL